MVQVTPSLVFLLVRWTETLAPTGYLGGASWIWLEISHSPGLFHFALSRFSLANCAHPPLIARPGRNSGVVTHPECYYVLCGSWESRGHEDLEKLACLTREFYVCEANEHENMVIHRSTCEVLMCPSKLHTSCSHCQVSGYCRKWNHLGQSLERWVGFTAKRR